MNLFLKVKPRSKNESVEKISETEFVVSVKEPPVDSRANWPSVAPWPNISAYPFPASTLSPDTILKIKKLRSYS